MRRNCFGFIAICMCCAISGCSQQATIVDDSTQIQVPSSDNLDVTIDYLFSEDQFAMSEIEEKVSGGLSRWIFAEKDKLDQFEWRPDPLVETLPAEVKPLVDELNRENFKTTDSHYLQGQIRFKSLGESITARPVVRNFWPPLSKQVDAIAATESNYDTFPQALHAVHPELSDEQNQQLVDACKLFDWTVRNIFLLDRADWPSAKDVDDKYLAELDTKWPPSSGVGGPGYQRFNWQLLSYGRGDDLERGRVFAQLALQRNIDVVMLAFDSPTKSSAPNEKLTPWLPAVVIGEQLFLFDTRLGLPIPGTAEGRIATLADVKQNPQLVKSLDLTVDESTSDDSDYWLDAEMLSAPVVALIDAPLESLTKRMAILERSLTGQKRIVCTSRPSELAKRLKSNPLIQETRLWSAEFYVQQFRAAVTEGLKQSRFNADVRERLSWFYSDEEYVDSYVRLRTAKNKYFLNKLESPRGVKDKGAFELFSTMIIVYTDDLIDHLENHASVLHAVGIQSGFSALEYQQRLAAVKSQMRLVRGDASYFLGLCHLEGANPSTAITWFSRVDALDNRGHWKAGVPYLTGRSHEMLDQFKDAVALYQIGKNEEKLSPQTHGNLIRARLIKTFLEPEIPTSNTSASR